MLEVPRWLVELAARDDPPTVIGDDLLRRFKRAGVTRFAPVAGTEEIAEEEAERAMAVGVSGLGIGLIDTFEEEPAPVLSSLLRLVGVVERYDVLRRLKLAAIDMRQVEDTARAMLQRGGFRYFERVLETGIVVTYARPYLASNRGGHLGRRWWPPAGPEREFHRRLIEELRNPYYAHSDRTPLRTVLDTGVLFGDDGRAIFTEAWTPLSDDDLKALANLAQAQGERFEKAAKESNDELRELLGRPSTGDE